jgi:hypothetical protein
MSFAGMVICPATGPSPEGGTSDSYGLRRALPGAGKTMRRNNVIILIVAIAMGGGVFGA